MDEEVADEVEWVVEVDDDFVVVKVVLHGRHWEYQSFE